MRSESDEFLRFPCDFPGMARRGHVLLSFLLALAIWPGPRMGPGQALGVKPSHIRFVLKEGDPPTNGCLMCFEVLGCVLFQTVFGCFVFYFKTRVRLFDQRCLPWGPNVGGPSFHKRMAEWVMHSENLPSICVKTRASRPNKLQIARRRTRDHPTKRLPIGEGKHHKPSSIFK